jgi:enoyl-CoA hydratase/carnithine racemase
MTFETLELEHADGVVTVWLNNPPVNAMSQTMFIEVARLFSSIPTELPATRAVIVVGRGQHFSAGGDIAELREISVGASDVKLRNIRNAFWAILDCPLPVVGVLHGAALGGGAALAAVCDVLIATPDATLGLPEINVGIMGGAGHMMRLLPQQIVRWMFLTGRPLSADRLFALGAVIQVVSDEERHEAAHAICRQIISNSRVAVDFAKRDLRIAEQSNLKQVYELEQGLTRELGKYADSREAGTAFLERRRPAYRNDMSLRNERDAS